MNQQKTHCDCRAYEDRPVPRTGWESGEELEDLPQTQRVEVSTLVDIDLHRWRCTKCGFVGYYSQRAYEYFVEGKTCHITGLRGDSDDAEQRKIR